MLVMSSCCGDKRGTVRCDFSNHYSASSAARLRPGSHATCQHVKPSTFTLLIPVVGNQTSAWCPSPPSSPFNCRPTTPYFLHHIFTPVKDSSVLSILSSSTCSFSHFSYLWPWPVAHSPTSWVVLPKVLARPTIVRGRSPGPRLLLPLLSFNVNQTVRAFRRLLRPPFQSTPARVLALFGIVLHVPASGIQPRPRLPPTPPQQRRLPVQSWKP